MEHSILGVWGAFESSHLSGVDGVVPDELSRGVFGEMGSEVAVHKSWASRKLMEVLDYSNWTSIPTSCRR